MTANPVNIPTPEIIDDLLIDNWELRWQVLDIFYQTRAKSSPYNPAVVKLIQQTIAMLQGEHDVNLQLIILAVYLLGGYEGILKLFNKLEIANPPEPEKSGALKTLREKVLKGERGHTFFDYFLFLYREGLFRESTLTLSLKLFTHDDLKKLFRHIPNPQQQALGFQRLLQQFPETNLNEMLADDDFQLLKENPRLINCLTPPLEPAILKQVEALSLSNFDNRKYLEATLEACAQLNIETAVPQIKTLIDDKEFHFQAITALGKLGTDVGMDAIISRAKSLFSGKKMEAARLLGNYKHQKAIDCLQKLSSSGNRKLKETALKSLANTGELQALDTIVQQLNTVSIKEKKSLLAVIASRHWPNVPETVAEKIIFLAEDSSLHPEIFQALQAMGHGNLLLSWFETLSTPLKTEYHTAACLFLAEYAAIPTVKEALIPHLQHPDWGFSYQLLCKLRNHFIIKDFPCLLKLLEVRESYKPLTIKERLELGKGNDQFVPAMCHYLNKNPQIPDQLLFAINNHLLTRRPALKLKELEEVTAGHPEGLRQLIMEEPFGQRDIASEFLYVLLLFCHYLDEITVDGASCFAIIVNLTRQYSGFFTETIWKIIMKILQSERTSSDTALLPYLDQLLETLRGRQDAEELRTMILTIKQRIFALSHDLVVFIESHRSRDLQVLKVKKVNG